MTGCDPAFAISNGSYEESIKCWGANCGSSWLRRLQERQTGQATDYEAGDKARAGTSRCQPRARFRKIRMQQLFLQYTRLSCFHHPVSLTRGMELDDSSTRWLSSEVSERT